MFASMEHPLQLRRAATASRWCRTPAIADGLTCGGARLDEHPDRVERAVEHFDRRSIDVAIDGRGRVEDLQRQIEQKHDLTALKILNMTLLRIKDRYVDPARVDPKKMFYSALDSVQFNIPEVLVEPDAARQKVKITVNDKPEVFEVDDVDSPWRLAEKLKKVFSFIESNMNAGADLAKVEYAAVNGMLNTLDPHSVLMDPEQARDMDVSTSGKFGGLGIVIRMIDRKLTVVRPMKNTPASRKGIKAGDHIVADQPRADGEPDLERGGRSDAR